MPEDAKILAFWNEYKACNDAAPDAFSIAEFGDSPELADHLADLIRCGIKTATSSDYQLYADGDEALPAIGGFFMVINSKREPVCIYQVTEVRIGAFGSVDAAFAFDEGEDDRSLAAWQRAHRRFFGLSDAPEGDEDSFLVVFYRFRLVWPLDL